MDESLPEVRIGDRERSAVDAHLQQALADGVLTLAEYDERTAQCWAARTRGDLDVLTRDLPAHRPEPQPPAPATPDSDEDENKKSLVERVVGGILTVALIGGAVYLGAQVLTSDDGSSVFGSRTVMVGPGQDHVEVGMLFGSLKVVVPDGVHVRTTGAVVMGSTNCAEACRATGREVVVDVNGALGSVAIVTQSEGG